jgi:hypothetical protein
MGGRGSPQDFSTVGCKMAERCAISARAGLSCLSGLSRLFG